MSRTGRLAAMALIAALAAGGCAASPAPVQAPALTTVTGTVWVANEEGSSLTAIDAATGVVRSTVAGVPSPHNVQAAADSTAVWVVTGSDQVLALDAATARLQHLGQTDTEPAHVVGAADGRVLVTASAQPSLVVYTASLVPTRRIALRGAPHGVRLSADGRTALVANTGAGTVDIVDTAAGTVRRSVRVGHGPVQTAVSPDGRVGFVSLGHSRQVARFDVATGRVTARAALPHSPAQVVLTGRGQLLVANQGSRDDAGSTVTVLDADTLTVDGTVTVGSGPHGLVADDTGRFAWVSNTFDGTVSVIDLQTLAVTATVPVGAGPNGITLARAVLGGSVRQRATLQVPGREDRPGPGGSAHSHQ